MRNLAGALLALALVVSFAFSTARSTGIFFEADPGREAVAIPMATLGDGGRETRPTLARSSE